MYVSSLARRKSADLIERVLEGDPAISSFESQSIRWRCDVDYRAMILRPRNSKIEIRESIHDLTVQRW